MSEICTAHHAYLYWGHSKGAEATHSSHSKLLLLPAGAALVARPRREDARRSLLLRPKRPQHLPCLADERRSYRPSPPQPCAAGSLLPQYVRTLVADTTRLVPQYMVACI